MKLKEYLQNGITIEDYFIKIQLLLGEIKSANSRGEQIILDVKEIEVIGQKLIFKNVYEDSVIEIGTIKDFIKKITFMCLFKEEQEFERITSFIKFIDDSEMCMRYEDIYEYCVDENYDENSIVNTGEINHEKINNILKSSEDIPKTDETGILDMSFWSQKGLNTESRDETGILDINYWNPNVLITEPKDETGILDVTYWNTIPGNIDGNDIKTIIAQLISRNDGKIVTINKDRFSIGKSNSDLNIHNQKVSRNHATIIKRENNFYIIDNESTNNTYVNNIKIPSKVMIEIFQGNTIKFADEEYDFRII